ncbi:MAG: phage tail tape measure protein [Candidatus Gastranaerophilales bacterium]|nr:phage tail tape measure protein [Candidatus Gastranaerophilales bacterium]
MADKKRQVVVELSLDTKDAEKNMKKITANLETMAESAGKYGDFSYFTTLLDYLAQIEDRLNELQKQDSVKFEDIFGKNATTFIDSITKSVSSLLEAPELLEQAVSKIASMDFSGNAEEAREAIELLINVYQRLGLEAPNAFDGYENWDTSTLRSKVDDIKKAATDLSGIDWGKAFNVEVPGSIEEQIKELDKQVTNLQRVKTRWNKAIENWELNGIVPKGKEGSTKEEIDEYCDMLRSNIEQIDEQMESLFSKKYDLSPDSIFQDFNDAVTKAFDFDLDTEEQSLRTHLDKMQAMVDACRENIDSGLANELQGVLDDINRYTFKPDEVDTSGIQKSMEAIIEKYQKTSEAANDTKQEVVSANDEINNSFNSSGDGNPKAVQQYEDLGEAAASAGDAAKGAGDDIKNALSGSIGNGANETKNSLNDVADAAENAGDATKAAGSAMESAFDGSNPKIAELQQQLEEMTKKAAAAEQEAYDLGSDVSHLQQENSELGNSLLDANNKIEEMTKNLSEQATKIQQLESTVSGMGDGWSKYFDASDQIEAQKKQIAELSTTCETLRSVLDNTDSVWGIEKKLESVSSALQQMSEMVVQSAEKVDQLQKEFSELNTQAGTNSISSESFNEILQILKELVAEMQPFVSALNNSETALGQMATEGGASIQTLVGQLESLSATLDEISQKSLGINIFQKASGSGGTDLAAYKESLLSLQDPLTQTIRLAQTLSGTNGTVAQAAYGIADAIGSLSNVKSKAAIENNANELQHWYNVLVQIIEASGQAEQINFEKIKFPTAADFSTDATDKFLQSLTDINTQSQTTTVETTQNFTELVAVLEKLSTTLDEVVKTFDGLKLNISTEELSQSLEQIKRLEQEIADLKQQMAEVNANTGETGGMKEGFKEIADAAEDTAQKVEGIKDSVEETQQALEDAGKAAKEAFGDEATAGIDNVQDEVKETVDVTQEAAQDIKQAGEEIKNAFSDTDIYSYQNALEGSLQRKNSNTFQWIVQDADEALVEVTAVLGKLGDITITKNPIEDIFSSDYSSKWLKNIQSEMTKTINELAQSMTKLSKMDVGTQQFTELENRISELRVRLSDLQGQLNNSTSIGTGNIESQLNKIFSNFGVSASQEIEKVKSSFNSLSDEAKSSLNELEQNVDGVEADIKALDDAFENFKSAQTFDEKTAAAQELAEAISKTTAEVKVLKTAEDTLNSSQSLSTDIQTWMDENQKAAKQFGDRLDELQDKLKNNIDPAKLKECAQEFENIQAEAKSANLVTSDFAKSAGKLALQLAGLDTTYEVFQKIVQVVREGIEVVTELDSAMAQLKIVTGATDSEMTQFLEESISLAKELGQSVSDILGTIETFSRLGYDLEEASTLTEFASILSNVADVDIDDATTGLTSIVKAYGYAAEDAEQVSDILITVGQNYAISAEEIMTALEKSGSALSATGLSLEESVALLAAANSSIQDASSVGTAMKTGFCLYVQKCA